MIASVIARSLWRVWRGGGVGLVTGAALCAATALAVFSCQGYLAHEFGGYAYDPTANCLETSGAIDVIAGADPGQCPQLKCWLSPCGTVYVTDEQCDAPPDYVDDTRATSGLCVKALALYAMPGHMLCPMPDAGTGGVPSGLGGGFVGCGL